MSVYLWLNSAEVLEALVQLAVESAQHRLRLANVDEIFGSKDSCMGDLSIIFSRI